MACVYRHLFGSFCDQGEQLENSPKGNCNPRESDSVLRWTKLLKLMMLSARSRWETVSFSYSAETPPMGQQWHYQNYGTSQMNRSNRDFG